MLLPRMEGLKELHVRLIRDASGSKGLWEERIFDALRRVAERRGLERIEVQVNWEVEDATLCKMRACHGVSVEVVHMEWGVFFSGMTVEK